MPVKIRELIQRSPTKWVRAWLKVLGPPFISLTVILTILGGAIAWHNTGRIDFGLLFLTGLSLVFIHFATSSFNDYFDFVGGTDNVNYFPTPFSGGSRVIQQGLLSPKALLKGAIILLSIGSALGIYLTVLRGWVIFIFGLIGVFLGFGYVQPKINLSKRGLGELAVGFCFGPLILCGVYFVQARGITQNAIFSSLIMGLLGMSVLWINQIPDYEADSACGKKNWVVRLGKEKSSKVYVFLIIFIFTLTFLGLVFGILPRLVLLCFLALPLAFKACRIALKNFNSVHELLPANALTIALLVVFASLLSTAYIITRALGL